MVNYQPDLDATSLTSSEEVSTSSINIIEVIETVIDSLDQSDSAMVNESEGGHIWKFKYGSVEVFVQLTGTTDEDTFTVWSIVMNLPAKNEPELMRKLLEMNWLTTFEAHFGIFNHQIAVISTRTVAELSPGEVSRLITVVASIADDNDDALIAEFGAA